MSELNPSKIRRLKRLSFLKDVFVVAFSAYGGPNMHLALYNKRLVEKKRYLSSEELLEIFSLCQMLPGPSSTQTLLAIAYKFGGPFLAFLTLLVWVLPAATALIIIALFMGAFTDSLLHAMRFVQPVAIAFVFVAGVKMMRKSLKTKLDIVLAVFAFAMAALLRHFLGEYVKTPWIFPLVLLIGGLVSYQFTSRTAPKAPKLNYSIPWRYLIAFIAFFGISAAIGAIHSNRLALLFENHYRFGSLVFGGGNVLIPMMYEQFVSFNQYMSADAFITGIGLVQAIPGPIFTFASYCGTISMQNYGMLQQVLGGASSTLAIFLPGTLLIFFVYPVWRLLKSHPVVLKALPGVIAASAGLVMAAAYLMFLPVGINWIEPDNYFFTNIDSINPVNILQLAIMAVVGFGLFRTKLASPWYIIAAIVSGILF